MLGWLRCETTKILGVWNPAYTPLTRKPDGQAYTLLRLGPYKQAWHASQDADRFDSALEGRATTVVSGFRVTARPAPFDVSDHELFTDPYEADALVSCLTET
ncbi:hypothetical protein ACFRCI_40160 [Streptomyces sp. NPDC056638]|uniref:hypothetical protein n=1 Tax=Streptomyces sp. NPDC056638 TaxID=3345887 RepID=UPI0036882DDD